MTNETTTTNARPTADELNAHLEAGGVVQVTTYGKSWLYEPEHAGCFRERNGSLELRQGRSWNGLSAGPHLLVSIRLGRYA